MMGIYSDANRMAQVWRLTEYFDFVYEDLSLCVILVAHNDFFMKFRNFSYLFRLY